MSLGKFDFFADRLYLAALLARENGACFYCLRQVRADNCQLDHVVAQAGGMNNSYRNIVVACHECNTTKQAAAAADFIGSCTAAGFSHRPTSKCGCLPWECSRQGSLFPTSGGQPGLTKRCTWVAAYSAGERLI
jgi:HNH endonuclease